MWATNEAFISSPMKPTINSSPSRSRISIRHPINGFVSLKASPKIPNNKSQISNKSQGPKFEIPNLFRSFDIGI
jgi:hypothetical protein